MNELYAALTAIANDAEVLKEIFDAFRTLAESALMTNRILAQAATKELHYIRYAKKARVRKKYINRVKRRIAKEANSQ